MHSACMCECGSAYLSTCFLAPFVRCPAKCCELTSPHLISASLLIVVGLCSSFPGNVSFLGARVRKLGVDSLSSPYHRALQPEACWPPLPLESAPSPSFFPAAPAAPQSPLGPFSVRSGAQAFALVAFLFSSQVLSPGFKHHGNASVPSDPDSRSSQPPSASIHLLHLVTLLLARLPSRWTSTSGLVQIYLLTASEKGRNI